MHEEYKSILSPPTEADKSVVLADTDILVKPKYQHDISVYLYLKFPFCMCYLQNIPAFLKQIFMLEMSRFLHKVSFLSFTRYFLNLFQIIFNLPLLNTFIPLMNFLTIEIFTYKVDWSHISLQCKGASSLEKKGLSRKGSF